MVGEIRLGCVVRVSRFGDVPWIVFGKQFDGRWSCISKAAIGRRHRQQLTSRSVGAGDCVVLADPPVYQPGDVIERAGIRYTVNRDLGDDGVEVIVPASCRTLRGGRVLGYPQWQRRRHCQIVWEQL